MAATFIQAASFANGGSTIISLPFPSANAFGNLGLCWCFTSNGLLPPSVGDSNGNTWTYVGAIPTNGLSISLFACTMLAAGANTVTANFSDSPINGTPSMIIEEFSYSAGSSLLALQPVYQAQDVSSTVFYVSRNGASAVAFSVTLITAIYAGGGYTWSAGPGPLRAQNQEGTHATNAVADNTGTSTPLTVTFAGTLPYNDLTMLSIAVVSA